ncbi:hypothetical protein [Methanococcoides methylutens]|uniref:Uncharacterized protein n=1 Tax=Methanococcoides methylutens MM1 TaxID=1434104 RepID=A0A0E3X0P5_METMT|nr:hypothetical protein [Methanococcoides methylutens]AKB84495.1 hypothetical protein MCMEM_0442 [Methanococcoides methylutens MM1]
MDEKKAKYLPTAGTMIGAIIGYILRPEAPGMGKLPLGTVMTRGSDLAGADEAIISIAQASFNYVVIGAVIGAIIGIAIFWHMSD